MPGDLRGDHLRMHAVDATAGGERGAKAVFGKGGQVVFRHDDVDVGAPRLTRGEPPILRTAHTLGQDRDSHHPRGPRHQRVSNLGGAAISPVRCKRRPKQLADFFFLFFFSSHVQARR